MKVGTRLGDMKTVSETLEVNEAVHVRPGSVSDEEKVTSLVSVFFVADDDDVRVGVGT